MKIKVREASGPVLDWMVAKCEGHKVEALPGLSVQSSVSWVMYSTDWAQGGSIIEREEIEIRTAHTGGWMANRARTKGDFEVGPTPLIAAMRCYCCSELGDEIDIPEELV